MRLVFLGTSGAQPTPARGLPCTCVERDGQVFMFDAGEAAQVAYMRAGLGWNRPMRIFITHMHGDHCTGLLGLLQTMSMRGRTEPLEVFGPAPLARFVSANSEILGFRVPFPLSITAASEGEVWRGRGARVLARRASHRVPAFSYLLVEDDRPGRFDEEGAARLGVPRGPLWGRLQAGEAVEVGGRRILPGQVLGPPRPGRRVGISGDTAPTKSLEGFFAGCDVLVFDATFLESERENALESFHSTAGQAAALAAAAGARRLVLTHFSSRYRDGEAHLAEAGAVHPDVVAARDQMEIEV
ncbi:Ribonuclease Z [Nitrosopumilaceae archaeon]|nr:ribonuclease Z [Nitrosopumilus sp.]MDA7944542.1 ribonuclease Z [Nitrosopumilus sp.]MDA7973110.1 ribonuclease Z [Nitrosopumilus sp.]MDA7998186.1 ribonuclease Z [Nitrosopumilus sp.]CAI9830848.1 Ribonuclease Z [Nitrosopumilaceae archaeon]